MNKECVLPVTLIRIISGGQVGADLAGLKAAKAYGIPTGGTMPQGFRTQDGPRPEYVAQFGVEEHESPAYPPRTIANILESDGTLLFGTNWNSPGEKLTVKTLKRCDKPFLKIDLKNPLLTSFVIQWLKSKQIKILNIAGNTERTCPGIEKCVYIYLATIFEKMGFNLVES
jgi:hypothetical protein